MFKLGDLERFAPLGIFFGSYTLVFLAWRYTFIYSLPFILGLLIAAALQPLIHFAEKKLGWRRGPVSGLITVLVLALLLFGGAFLLVLGVRELTGFLMEAATGGFPEFSPPVRNFFQKAGKYLQELGPGLLEENAQELKELLKGSSEMVFAAVKGILSVLGSLPMLLSLLLVTACTAFFAARDFPQLCGLTKSLLGPKAMALLKRAADSSSGAGQKYMLSYALIYFISFCEAYVIIYMLGLPYPLTTAVITCIADVLPVLGPGIVFTPLAVYQLLIGEYGRGAGLMAGWLIMTCVRQVVEPKLVASTVKLHPLAMLAAVYCSLAAGSLWVLVYMLGLFLLYGLLRRAGALPGLKLSQKNSHDSGTLS